MLDRLPAWARHLVFMVAPVLLAWIASDVIPQLDGKEGLAGVAGVLLTVIVTVLTPMTRQYGIGARTNGSDVPD